MAGEVYWKFGKFEHGPLFLLFLLFWGLNIWVISAVCAHLVRAGSYIKHSV